MAIRFTCPDCRQPIEVDDEWALRPVICPYCRKTVVAPEASTLVALPEASVAEPAFDLPSAATFADNDVTLPPAGNPLAVVALLLALGAFALFFVAAIVLQPHMQELMPVAQGMVEAMRAGQPDELLRIQNEFLARHNGMPAWLVAAFVIDIGACLAWLAGVICALIALRRPQRRRLAVGALIVSGLLPVFLCCGGGM